MPRIIPASSRLDMTVLLVTNLIRCPALRRRRTESAAPGIGSPLTCSTPSTSSRIAAMDAESIRSELTFRVSRSSGPGGQHAQKSSTRVEALYDVAASAGLTEPERNRVLSRLWPLVRAIAQDERSQARNKELAAERILEQVKEAARRRRKRQPTAPTKASYASSGSTRNGATPTRSGSAGGALARTPGLSRWARSSIRESTPQKAATTQTTSSRRRRATANMS